MVLWRIIPALAALFCSALHAEEVLHVLAWPGYASAEAVRSFEARYNVSVEVTVIRSDDELWQHASRNEGANFDLIAVNSAELRRFIDAKLVVPLRLTRIPNVRKQLSRFRRSHAIPGISRDGTVYGVPYSYSAMGLIYNRKLVKEAPSSMEAMWDPRYRGKVLAYNGSSHSFSFTALSLGMRDPFRLSETQFKRVLDRLVALRSNVLKFYADPAEVVEAFRDNEVALVYANYGEQQIKQLREAGEDIGYVIPAEGALARLDCWAITRGARNRALAEAWIDHMLTANVSAQLTEEQGLANTLRESRSKTMQESDKLVWLTPVEDARKRSLYWERIMSGVAPRPR